MVLELSGLVVDGSTEESLCAGASKVVCAVRKDWQPEDLLFRVYTDGITNKLVGVYHKNGSKSEQLLVRVYGNKTDLFIDRSKEKRNIQFLGPHGCAPPYHCSFANGLCYSFIPGDPLSPSSVVREEVCLAVAQQMAKLNSIKCPEGETDPMLFPKMESFRRLLPEDFRQCNKLKKAVASGISQKMLSGAAEELRAVVASLGCPLVLSHNDLLLGNIIWRREEKDVRFIDFEYTALNYQPYDVANHFCEFAGVDTVDYNLYPDEEFQIKWLTKYISHLPSSVASRPMQWWLGAVAVLALASHLFWGTWAMVQALHSEIGFDFDGYAVIRLDEYRRRKDEFLSLGKKAAATLAS